MKRVLGDIKSIAVLLLVVICVVLCNKIATHIFSIDGYSCTFDSKISNYHKNEIFDFVNETKDFKNSSLKFISKKIIDHFCAIKSTELIQLPSGILQVKLKAFDPQFIVNDMFILVENGTLFDKNIFSQSSVENCHALTIKDLDCIETCTVDVKQNLSETCKKMIFSLPKESFQNYQIVRESETKSYMTDRLQENFIIIFSDKNVPNEKILFACTELKKELKVCGEFSKKRNMRRFADVRFKDQIVLFKDRRGR